MLEKRRAVEKERYQSSEKHRVDYRAKAILRNVISRKQKTFILEKHLGYSVSDLRSHLRKNFKKGMSFKNFGEWHIDHTVPKFHFSYKSYDCVGFILCWSLSNLKPMWMKDNLKKGNKIT
jgi:hypothetical protein